MDTFILRGSITGKMTDDEFLKLCLENPELRIERNSNLEIVVMSPASSLSGFFSGEVLAQLRNWNRLTKTGVVFDSSSGFTLPDRSVFAPDAAWVQRDRWNTLSKEQKNSFAPLCPDFVIEVVSKSDQITDAKRKMKTWISNGAQLAWLIDPEDETVYIYRPNHPEFVIEGFNQGIRAGAPLDGFVLDTALLKE